MSDPIRTANHVFRHLLTGSHACVITLRDDVGQAVVDDNLDLDVRIFAQEFC